MIERNAIENRDSPNISGNVFSYQVSVNNTRSASSPCVNKEAFKIKQKCFVPDLESQKTYSGTWWVKWCKDDQYAVQYC